MRILKVDRRPRTNGIPDVKSQNEVTAASVFSVVVNFGSWVFGTFHATKLAVKKRQR